MKIAIILGTRPEIIKLYSIIKYCSNKGIKYKLIHTNQHYSKLMDNIFFEELSLPKPHYNLEIGSCTHGQQTGRMLEKIEKVLLEERPTHVIVQGDTNTTLAGALSATKLKIKVCHIEAGLRSYDKNMPEEINRILTDHISDFLFCPTIKQKGILLSEGISINNVYVTGNTIVDAVYQVKQELDDSLLNKYRLGRKNYVLLTMHRPSNVDIEDVLINHFANISKVANDCNLKVIFPIHPRTAERINSFAIRVPENFIIIEPVGFKEFLMLEKNAKIIITDSGGVQEEACILGVPSLNLRDNTERTECIDVGASKIVGSSYNKLMEGFDCFLNIDYQWDNPFGEGDSYLRVFKILFDDDSYL